MALVAWGLVWMLPASHYSLGAMNDWIPFEIGARTLVHYHHLHAFASPALHVYADTPMLQFGPLPMLLLAAFQVFPPHAVAVGFGVAMIAAGAGCIAAIEAAARHTIEPRHHATLTKGTFALGLLVMPVWSFEVGYWHHLDDVLALLCLAVASYVLSGRQQWWSAALLLGTAAATKPWAVIFLPLLLALPRRDLARAVLLALATAAAWWLPFVVAAPATLHAVGAYQTVPDPGSILYLVGVHGDTSGWLRGVQMLAGLAATAYVVRRRGWREAVMVGMAARLALDPFSYSYYALGPLTAAALLDLSRIDRSRLPRWTLLTLAATWVLPRLNTHTPVWAHTFGPVHLPVASAVARLVWVGVTCTLLMKSPPASEPTVTVTPRPVPVTIG